MITRRAFLGTTAAAAGLALAPGPSAATTIQSGSDPLMPLWSAWKSMHLAPTGRILDRFQGGDSHSEGQGYALLMAEAVGDRETFDLILDWTMQKLAVRSEDNLLAWRWSPADGGTITDRNNASDGDLFFAWALCRAAERFAVPAYLDTADRIAASLVSECIRPCPARSGCTVLLPGRDGFETGDGFILNPAYYMIRALEDLGRITGRPELNLVAADGTALLATLARSRLVPDWIALTSGGVAEAPNKSAVFGYEALRVPMYLFWSDLAGHPAVARAADAYQAYFTEARDDAPVKIDPGTGVVQETSPDPGYRALATLASCAHGSETATLMPAFRADQPYYPATLHLLSLIAQRESQFGCSV